MESANPQETKLMTKIDEIDAVVQNKGLPSYEDSATFYNSMTGDAFDEYAKAKGWTQPETITQLVGKGKVVDLDPATTEILDIGAGTGQVGLYLSKKGFSGIVGLDAAPNLLEKAKGVKAYKELREMYIGMGLDKFPDDLKNRFDMVTAAGVWIEGHIPASGLDDAFAALKVGGYLVSATRSYIWVKGEKGGYKDLIDKYIEDGIMELVHTETWTQGVKGLHEGPWAEVISIAFVMRRIK